MHVKTESRKHVFTEKIPLIPYKLNSFDIRNGIFLVQFDYSLFFPQAITSEALTSFLCEAVLSQLTSPSLISLVQSLLRLISIPLTQTHHPCLPNFCDSRNYSPSNCLIKFQLVLATSLLQGLPCQVACLPSPKHQKQFKLKTYQFGVSCKTFSLNEKNDLKEKYRTLLQSSVSLPSIKDTASHFIQNKTCSLSKYPPRSDHQSTQLLSFAHQIFL